MSKYQSIYSENELFVLDLDDGEAALKVVSMDGTCKSATLSPADIKEVIKDLKKILKGEEL